MNKKRRNEQGPIAYVANQSTTERDAVVARLSAAQLTTRPVESLQDIEKRVDCSQPHCLLTDWLTVRQMLADWDAAAELPRDRGHSDAEPVRNPTLVVSAALLQAASDQQPIIALLGESFERGQLLQAVHRTTQGDRQSQQRASLEKVADRAARLSERDQEIMRMIYQGLANKVIANRLELGLRTIESARARIFQQMGVETAVDLVRMLALANYYEEGVD